MRTSFWQALDSGGYHIYTEHGPLKTDKPHVVLLSKQAIHEHLNRLLGLAKTTHIIIPLGLEHIPPPIKNQRRIVWSTELACRWHLAKILMTQANNAHCQSLEMTVEYLSNPIVSSHLHNYLDHAKVLCLAIIDSLAWLESAFIRLNATEYDSGLVVSKLILLNQALINKVQSSEAAIKRELEKQLFNQSGQKVFLAIKIANDLWAFCLAALMAEIRQLFKIFDSRHDYACAMTRYELAEAKSKHNERMTKLIQWCKNSVDCVNAEHQPTKIKQVVTAFSQQAPAVLQYLNNWLIKVHEVKDSTSTF